MHAQTIAKSIGKRWFLAAVLLGAALAWYWPAALNWTRWAQPRVVIPLALFLVAWTMDGRRLLLAVKRPWPALWAVAVSYTLPPLAAWGGGPLMPVVDFQIGLLVCASVPCTLASAVIWTRLAGGDEATALLSTFVGTSLSWLLTPVWLALATGSQIAVDLPGMMLDLAGTLLLPVALGQAARAIPVFGRAALNGRKTFGIVSQLLVLVIMFRAVRSVVTEIRVPDREMGGLAVLTMVALCLGIHLVALLVGWWGGRRLGFDRSACIAVAFAGSQKTLPVSLLLLDRYFSAYPLAVVPLVVYHAGQLIVDTFIADRWAESPPPPSTLGV